VSSVGVAPLARWMSGRGHFLWPLTVQVCALAIPFLIIPYLARVLSASSFGAFAFCQAFAVIGTAIVDYGFQISATRDLAEAGGDGRAVRARASGVLTAKATVAVFYALGVLALWPIFPAFFRSPAMVTAATAAAIFQGLNFYWFFAGLQRVLIASLLDLLARSLGAIGILIFVHHSNDALAAVASLAIGNAIAFVASLSIAWRRSRGFSLSFVEAKRSMAAGRHIFVQGLFGNIYVGATSFVLGLFVSPYYVGVFSAAEKLVRAAQLPQLPIRLVFYPKILAAIGRSPEAGKAQLLRLAGFVLPVMAFGSFILFVAAEPIVRLALGANLAPAANLLRLMAIVPLLASATDFISVFWLLANGRDRMVTWIVVGGLASQTLTIIVFAVLWPGWAGATAIVLSQATALAMCVLTLKCHATMSAGTSTTAVLPSNHSANS
jgi:polysaccharide transporter, PST family